MTTISKLHFNGVDYDVWGYDIAFKTATSWATVTINDLSTKFTPNQDFTVNCWTVKEWMQYVLRINSWATAYNMTLWTWITNPFNENLLLIANKTSTAVLLATSSNSLELFSLLTAD